MTKKTKMATLQTIVTRVLQRELEAKRKSFESLTTDIAYAEASLDGMRTREIELAGDIKALEKALEDN